MQHSAILGDDDPLTGIHGISARLQKHLAPQLDEIADDRVGDEVLGHVDAVQVDVVLNSAGSSWTMRRFGKFYAVLSNYLPGWWDPLGRSSTFYVSWGLVGATYTVLLPAHPARGLPTAPSGTVKHAPSSPWTLCLLVGGCRPRSSSTRLVVGDFGISGLDAIV